MADSEHEAEINNNSNPLAIESEFGTQDTQDDANLNNFDNFDNEDDDGGEIPEAMQLLHPLRSSFSEITNDESSDLILVEFNEAQRHSLEGDGPIVPDRDVGIKVSGPKETHDLRALATTGNKMSDRSKRQPNFCSVDVVGPDGVKKRFAPGTKAAFAVERFNCQLRDPALPVVCIVACKDGEDPIEFGPDVELVSYDDSWTLKTLREAVQYIIGKPVNEGPVHKTKDTIIEGSARVLSPSKPVTKVPGVIFGPATNTNKYNGASKSNQKTVEDMEPLQYFGVKNWEDLYPGGKLPEGDTQDCSPICIGKVTLMFIVVLAFAGSLSYMLDPIHDPTVRF